MEQEEQNNRTTESIEIWHAWMRHLHPEIGSSDAAHDMMVRYVRLQEFVESSMPQPLKWRLCANCQQATGCGTGVDPEMKLKAVERRTQIDRWACLSVKFQAQLPLEPCSS